MKKGEREREGRSKSQKEKEREGNRKRERQGKRKSVAFCQVSKCPKAQENCNVTIHGIVMHRSIEKHREAQRSIEF